MPLFVQDANPLLLIIFIFAVGALAGVIVTKLWSSSTVKDLWNRASLVKQYWKFVVFFIPVVLLSYVGVWLFVPEAQVGNAINVVGQISTLTFAVFVGWFAFIQVFENRIDKWKELAREYFTAGKYRRAKNLYEQVYLGAPGDFGSLSELVELYVVAGDDTSFDAKITALHEAELEDEDTLVTLYLRVANSVLKEDTGTARSHVDKLMMVCRENPHGLLKFAWDFDALKYSQRYKTLQPSDAKRILDNLIAYLDGELSLEHKSVFESGKYDFEKAPATPPQAVAPKAPPEVPF